MSVKNEDGFKAWQKLHIHFGPSLSAKQGMALADFSGMVAKPATKPGETKSLTTELERRMKMVEEVTGELISDSHAKSVLVGMLDPMTRQHTAMHHGGNTGYEKLKRVVLEFTNNVAGSDSAMQVDQIAETLNEEQEQEHTGADPAAWTRPGTGEQYVNAFGKGASQCYNCQGYGHLARECPSKGKGKGFEKGTDEGKGKGMSTYGPIRNNAKGKGNPRGRCLERRRALTRRQGQGPQPSGGNRRSSTSGSPRSGGARRSAPYRTSGADARPGAGGREQGGLDVDRFREEAPPTGRGEEGQEGESSGVEDHPHHRARDGQQRHDQEQVGSHRPRGEKFHGYSEEGTVRSITTQVCDVNKGLLDVRKVMKAGNHVVFDSTGSYIEDKKTHERIRGRDVHVEDVRQERRV